MPRELVNPKELFDSVQYGYSHAALQHAGRTLHVAGQVGWNAKGELVGPGDLAQQTRQALANLKTVLAAAGARPADLVRLRTYVVKHTPDSLGVVLAEIKAFYGDAAPAPNTYLGVEALAVPGLLIEIEATAAIP
jgi:enamine deaminase RidA (YjgF/YER057c/UK114 family)